MAEMHMIAGMQVYTDGRGAYSDTGYMCAFLDKEGYACTTDARWFAQTWQDRMEAFCLKHSRRRNNDSLKRKGVVVRITKEAK